jgi:hypothetical protein
MAMGDPADAGYRKWLREYWDRREQLFRPEVMRVTKEAFDAAAAETEGSVDYPEFGDHARTRRSAIEHRFCLLLWTQGVAAPGKAASFRSRIASLTFALDQAGVFALMLYPEDRSDAPHEPVVLPSPAKPIDMNQPEAEKMWEYIVKGFIEAAYAIIIEGAAGVPLIDLLEQRSGLVMELNYIFARDLTGRVLLFDDNSELYRIDDPQRWPLERIADAVAHAASQ